ncbi:CLUMA_CG008157, isoform A [Clunio marinus]|uniref:CLUMA_CG008157, isoform A n=1 Tax=Clunio marinus TaxID=568069 RepID=A0A1J1I8B5_9DIPT|nr:CLUMA_CG008157, isoform A [Clunio marinus]
MSFVMIELPNWELKASRQTASIALCFIISFNLINQTSILWKRKCWHINTVERLSKGFKPHERVIPRVSFSSSHQLVFHCPVP